MERTKFAALYANLSLENQAKVKKLIAKLLKEPGARAYIARLTQEEERLLNEFLRLLAKEAKT